MVEAQRPPSAVGQICSLVSTHQHHPQARITVDEEEPLQDVITPAPTSSTEQAEDLVEDSFTGECFDADPNGQTQHGHASIQAFGVQTHRISAGLPGSQR